MDGWQGGLVMSKHEVFVQYNGDGISKFYKIEVEAPDDGSSDLEDLAIAEAEKLLLEEFDEEEPDRADYDTKEEYEEALNDYKGEVEDWLNEWSYEGADIVDPEDAKELRDSLIGLCSKEYADNGDEHEEEFVFDDEYCTVKTRVTVVLDNDGCIKDVKDVYAEGLEWEGVRSSSWAECYPDYDWLKHELISELGLE